MKPDLIERSIYLDRIKPFVNKQIIKVLVGQRRIGKSYILYQLMHFLQQQDPEGNQIRIELEQEAFRHIKTGPDLYAYIKSLLQSSVRNYVFVDEIQEVTEFENAIRSLHNENAADIYITGSNAQLLSGELATRLSGRYVQFEIHALSYMEFLQFHALTDSDESLRIYLTIGGLPYLRHLGTDSDLAFEYLRNVYASILLKDVVARAGIRNVAFLENLVGFLSGHLGSLVSAQNIARFLKSQQIAIPVPTILTYLQSLTNAFFVYKVPRTDVVGLKIFEIGEKYYFEDLGLRNSIRGFGYGRDLHKLLENAVYQHLRICQYNVYVGKWGEKEIDFVAEKNGERVLIQAAVSLLEASTQQREFGNLLALQVSHPKYVVSMDPHFGTSYQGIKHLHLREFLKMQAF